MSPVKEAAQRAIDSLPDDASIDELFEAIVFYANFDEGLKDIEAGRVTPLEDVENLEFRIQNEG